MMKNMLEITLMKKMKTMMNIMIKGVNKIYESKA